MAKRTPPPRKTPMQAMKPPMKMPKMPMADMPAMPTSTMNPAPVMTNPTGPMKLRGMPGNKKHTRI